MSGTGLPGTYVEGFHDRDAVEKMTYRPLGGTGHSVSVLGLGASALGGVFHDTTEEECCLVVHAALKAGVNVIDTAPWYGQGKSESMLGLALKGVPRQAYLLNTKVGRYEQAVDEMFDFSAARVTRSVDESLHRMGVDYIDTIQVHDVEFAPSLDVIVEQTLPALDALRRSGKVRMIGITGYALAPLREVLERSAVKIDAVLSYCRLTLIDASLEEHLDFFAARGVGLYNAAPTGMGLLTPQGPPAWHPASNEDKELCRELRELCVTQAAAPPFALPRAAPAARVVTRARRRAGGGCRAARAAGGAVRRAAAVHVHLVRAHRADGVQPALRGGGALARGRGRARSAPRESRRAARAVGGRRGRALLGARPCARAARRAARARGRVGGAADGRGRRRSWGRSCRWSACTRGARSVGGDSSCCSSCCS